MRAAIRVVLAPASWVLNRLHVAPKLALIGAVLIVPTVFVTWQYVHLENEQIDFSAKELLGVEYLEQTNELLAAVTTMRLAAVADESPERAADIAAAQQRVRRAVADVDGVDERLGGELAVDDAWAKVRRQIAALPTDEASAEQTYAAYTKALDALLGLNVEIGDASNLILDPDLDSFYLMDAVVNQLPVAITTAGGTAALQRVFTEGGQTPEQADFVTLAMNHGEMDSALGKVGEGFPTTFENTADPTVQPALAPKLAAVDKAERAEHSTTEAALKGDFRPATATQRATDVVAATAALANATAPELAKLIQARVDGLKAERRTALIIVTAAIVLGLYLFVALFATITSTLRRMVEVADGIAHGDADQQIDVTSRDEFGRLGDAFGRMSGYLRDSAGVADRIAEGDLTVAAEPRSERDVLGHALQSMVQRLRALVGRVSTSAATLTNASRDVAATSDEASRAIDEIASAMEQVAVGAREQQQSVRSTRTATESITEASRDSAAQAEATREAAEFARGAAGEGLQAALDATEAMRTVREASADASRAIAELGSRSREIGGIVDTINGIAEQTNLLALNAAIEAARAGEHGRGFAVVAEEVRQLAEESQQATASIAALITEMQRQTDAAVAAVDAGAARSQEGDVTVERAREAFAAIEDAVRGVAERVEEIAGAIGAVVSGSEHVLGDVDRVAQVADRSTETTEHVSASTQQTSASTQEIAAAAKELQDTARELEQAVAAFTID